MMRSKYCFFFLSDFLAGVVSSLYLNTPKSVASIHD